MTSHAIARFEQASVCAATPWGRRATWGNIALLGFYGGYVGIMENRMETTVELWDACLRGLENNQGPANPSVVFCLPTILNHTADKGCHEGTKHTARDFEGISHAVTSGLMQQNTRSCVTSRAKATSACASIRCQSFVRAIEVRD